MHGLAGNAGHLTTYMYIHMYTLNAFFSRPMDD